MKITEKTKSWIKDHRDGLTTAAAVTGIAVFYGAIIAVCVKAYKDDAKATQNFLDTLGEAASRGDSILPGPNGYYWIIPNEGN